MSSLAPLGYRNQDEVGWTGYSGSVPIQGPIEEPCTECGKSRRWHKMVGAWESGCSHFRGQPVVPRPEEIARALVVTEWTCPHCGQDNDVWGEGAVYSWMECAYCGQEAYLEMDP